MFSCMDHTEKVEKGRGPNGIQDMTSSSVPSEDDGNGRANSDEDSEETDRNAPYRYDRVISLNLGNQGSFSVTVTRLIDALDIEMGDYLGVSLQRPEPDTDGDSGVPVLAFEKVVDPELNSAGIPVNNVRKIVNKRVKIPPHCVTEELLDQHPSQYESSNPLVFQPLYEPGDDGFLLFPLGRASELFRDPDEDHGRNPLQSDMLPSTVNARELAAYAQAGEEKPLEEMDRLELLYEVYRDENPVDQFDAENLPRADQADLPDRLDAGDLVTISREDGDGYEYHSYVAINQPPGWDEVNRQTIYRTFQRFPSMLTSRMLEAAEGTLDTDPVMIERRGDRFEVHYLVPGMWHELGIDILGVDPRYVEVLRSYHTRAGRAYLTETFDNRGEQIPEDHPLRNREVELIVLPVGDAELYPDSDTAIDLADDPEKLVDQEETFDESSDQETSEETGSEQQTLEQASGSSGETESTSKDQTSVSPVPHFDESFISTAADVEDADPDDVRDALDRLNSKLDGDKLEQIGIVSDDLDPVTIGSGDNADLVVDDGVTPTVEVTFSTHQGIVATLLKELYDDVPSEVRLAAGTVHKKQANKLMSEANAPEEYTFFGTDHDAIVYQVED